MVSNGQPVMFEISIEVESSEKKCHSVSFAQLYLVFSNEMLISSFLYIFLIHLICPWQEQPCTHLWWLVASLHQSHMHGDSLTNT